MAKDALVERVEARRGQEVSHLVKRDADVEAQVHEQRRDQRVRTREDEPQHVPLEQGDRGQGQNRGDERDVERDQDVVRDDPAFLECGGGRAGRSAARSIACVHDASPPASR